MKVFRHTSFSFYVVLSLTLLAFSAMAGHERTPISQIDGTGVGKFTGQIGGGPLRWYSFWASAGDTISITARFNGTPIVSAQSQLTLYWANDGGLVEVGDSWMYDGQPGPVGTGLQFITLNYGSGESFGSNSLVYVAPFTAHYALMLYVSNPTTDPSYELMISGATGSQAIRNTFF